MAKQAPDKAPIGAPTKYKRDYAIVAGKLTKRGFTMEDLADAFDVTLSTVYLWKSRHKAFSDAITCNRGHADEAVENALFQRALGYEHPDVHISNFKGEITTTHIIKRYPPDTTAATFWLRNRNPNRWKLNPEAEDPDANQPIQRIEIEVIGANPKN